MLIQGQAKTVSSESQKFELEKPNGCKCFWKPLL